MIAVRLICLGSFCFAIHRPLVVGGHAPFELYKREFFYFLMRSSDLWGHHRIIDWEIWKKHFRTARQSADCWGCSPVRVMDDCKISVRIMVTQSQIPGHIRGRNFIDSLDDICAVDIHVYADFVNVTREKSCPCNGDVQYSILCLLSCYNGGR